MRISHIFITVAAALCSTAAYSQVSNKAAYAGTWLLNGNVKAIRIILKNDGTFDYAGQGAKSKGKWSVEGTQLRFNWTHIDSQKVDPAKVVGRFPIANGTFRIGKYVYAKPGTPVVAAQK
jgi:hypothetical protein